MAQINTPWRYWTNSTRAKEKIAIVDNCGFSVADLHATVANSTSASNLANHAAHIVRCVNAHDALLAALQSVKARIEQSEHWWMDEPSKGGFDLDAIEAALKLAKGE